MNFEMEMNYDKTMSFALAMDCATETRFACTASFALVIHFVAGFVGVGFLSLLSAEVSEKVGCKLMT